MSAARDHVAAMLEGRLDTDGAAWLRGARAELGRGVDADRFCALVSLASRHAPRGALSPGAAAIDRAASILEGWNPERWTGLEAVRVLLVLSRPDLPEPALSEALEEAFRYADVGEACALHRSLQLLPGPERFVWRAGEGCRSNMRAVFEAAACDTGYPFRSFDDVAWRQLAVKAIFVGAPLWRVHGLDRRLDAELARMALDLADERRSAGRPVPHELWLCLGAHAGERGLAAIEQELRGSHTLGRRGAAIALARAGALPRLRELLEAERDPSVAVTMRAALEGGTGQAAFRDLDPTTPTDPR